MSEHTIIEGINYGPLAVLVGTWEGDKGVDRAPEPDGEESSPYFETIVFEVAADANSPQFGIVQAPFMFKQARTTAFTHTITVKGDEMRYSESTILDIYDKKSYDHSDVNTLRRVT